MPNPSELAIEVVWPGERRIYLTIVSETSYAGTMLYEAVGEYGDSYSGRVANVLLCSKHSEWIDEDDRDLITPTPYGNTPTVFTIDLVEKRIEVHEEFITNSEVVFAAHTVWTYEQFVDHYNDEPEEDDDDDEA